ncbi:MAG: hypothetical protein LBQ84_02260 [Flavobacteriaceae bacterium]|jgi:hypothetical protein|nr:hypothetical protein [Flavobacteriaceae bacterium]
MLPGMGRRPNWDVPTFIGTCIPTKELSDGNKVPSKGYKFANKNKFDSSIYEVIDPNYFYELIDEYLADRNYKKVRDIGTFLTPNLQFYPNGSVRELRKTYMDPNPDISGNRGIIYKQNNKIKIDFYDIFSSDGRKKNSNILGKSRK